MHIKSTKDQTISLQSRGEAHLYVAIAKADGIVSKTERALTGAYAAGSQKLYDVLKINSELAKKVQKDIKDILSDSRYKAWTLDDHYEEAKTLFKKAEAAGNWSVSLASLKHEHGLLQVALLEEYVFVESRAVKDIVKRLERDFGK
jgi:hypothetical protein